MRLVFAAKAGVDDVCLGGQSRGRAGREGRKSCQTPVQLRCDSKFNVFSNL